jgi:hypothetical protein
MGSCDGILATGHPTEKLGGFARRSHKPLINLAKHWAGITLSEAAGGIR